MAKPIFETELQYIHCLWVSAREDFCFCSAGVRSLFDFPASVRRVTMRVFPTPGRNRVRFSYDKYYGYTARHPQYTYVPMTEYDSQKMRHALEAAEPKRKTFRKIIYIELQYEERA